MAIKAVVPDMRWADAPDCLHHPQRRYPANTRPHQCGLAAPHIAPARGLPLWEDGDAQVDDGLQIEADWDMAAQPAPDYCVDQRVNW